MKDVVRQLYCFQVEFRGRFAPCHTKRQTFRQKNVGAPILEFDRGLKKNAQMEGRTAVD